MVGLLTLSRHPFHLKMRSRFAGTREPQTLEEINGAVESDDLQT